MNRREHGSGCTIPPSQPLRGRLVDGRGFLADARDSACEMLHLVRYARARAGCKLVRVALNHWCAPLIRPGPLSYLAGRKLLGILTPGGSSSRHALRSPLDRYAVIHQRSQYRHTR